MNKRCANLVILAVCCLLLIMGIGVAPSNTWGQVDGVSELLIQPSIMVVPFIQPAFDNHGLETIDFIAALKAL
jgi:hypothetical protein